MSENKNLTLLQRFKLITKEDIALILSRLIMAFTTFGYIRAFTILVPVFKNYLQASDTTVNMLSGALLLGPAISALFTGIIVPKFGSKNPCILSAVILSVGFWLFAGAIQFQVKNIYVLCGIYFLICSIPTGILTSCSFINTAKYATSEILGLVLTLQTIGATLGSLVLQPLFILILDFIENDIVKMMYLVAFLQSSNILAAYLLVPDSKYAIHESEEQLNPEAAKPKLFSLRVFFSPAYFIFTVTVCLFLIGYFCTIINLKSLYSTYGLSDLTISSLFFVSGLIELISRLFYAFILVDAYDKIILLSMTCCCLGASFLILCLPALASLRIKAEMITWIGVSTYSIFSAGWSSLLNAVVHKITDPKDFPVGSGMHIFVTGNANSLGPILSGLIVDFLRNSNVDQTLGQYSEYNPYAMLAESFRMLHHHFGLSKIFQNASLKFFVSAPRSARP